MPNSEPVKHYIHNLPTVVNVWYMGGINSPLSTVNSDTIYNFRDIVLKKVETYFNSPKWVILKTKLVSYKNDGLLKISSIHAIEANIRKILTKIYELKPIAVSIQFTSDESLLISFSLPSMTCYFEYFPENTSTGIPEYILNAYSNKSDVIDSFVGDLDSTFNKILSVRAELNRTKHQMDVELNDFIFNFSEPTYPVTMSENLQIC